MIKGWVNFLDRQPTEEGRYFVQQITSGYDKHFGKARWDKQQWITDDPSHGAVAAWLETTRPVTEAEARKYPCATVRWYADQL